MSDLEYWEAVTVAIEAFGLDRSDAQGIVMIPANDVLIHEGFVEGREPAAVAANIMGGMPHGQ
jgi:hypothetical protein